MAALTKTKLERSYYATRIVSILSNYMLPLAIVCLLLPFAVLLTPAIVFIYLIYAIIASLVLVICTFFLIFLTVNDPSSPLVIIWSRFNNGFFETLIKACIDFASIFVPIAGGTCIITSIVLLVLVNKGLGRANIHKDRAILIVSIVFSAIGVLFAIIFKIGVYGGMA